MTFLIVVVAIIVLNLAACVHNPRGVQAEQGSKIIHEDLFPTPKTDAWKPYRDMTEEKEPIQ